MHCPGMRSPLLTILVTFVPVVLLALLMPQWLPDALIVVMIGETGFFTAVANRLVQLKRECGTIPYRLRYPFFVFGAGLLCYGLISFAYVSASARPFVALLGALAFAASKFWISRGPLWPFDRRPASA